MCVESSDNEGFSSFKEGWKTGVNEVKLVSGLFRSGGGQSFWKQLGEVASRFTWQLPQTLLGYGFSQMVNYTSSAEVDFYGGATTVSSNWFDGTRAVTLGSFINGPEDLEADPNDALFQHEYGHYLQSQSWGLGYMSKVGIPSLLSAAGDHKHKYYTIEQDANARAIKYFNKRGALETWNFVDNPIGRANKWDMVNIYKNGTTEFTDEFSSALDNAHTKTSFWDIGSGLSPLRILVTGLVNHKHNSWVNEK